MLDQLGITKEDILDKVSEKILSDFSERGESVYEIAMQRMDGEIRERLSKGLNARIDDVLNQGVAKLLEQKVTPRNIFGDKEGEETTIRAALADRAKTFWLTKVDINGKESNWGGKERWQYVMDDTVKRELDAIIKQNIDAVIDGFKRSVIATSVKAVEDNIKKHFK